MACDPALQAVHEPGSLPQGLDLSTMRGLMEVLGAWIDGGQAPGGTGRALGAMHRRLQGTLEASRADLGDNPTLHPDLRDPMARTVQGYERMARGLAALRRTFGAGDREGGRSALEDLRQAAAEVRDQKRRIDEWMAAPVPRCLRCGGVSGDREMRCPSCRLDLLVPDPSYLEDSSHRLAVLPGPYVAVFEAWKAIHEGRGTLDDVARALDLLEEAMAEQRRLGEAGARTGSAGPLGSARSGADLVAEGILRMRRAARSRLAADLNEGWDRIFEGGSRLEALFPTRPALGSSG